MENPFEANRNVKEVLWVPVLVVKMGVNLSVCVHASADGINKCSRLVSRKQPTLASVMNPHR